MYSLACLGLEQGRVFFPSFFFFECGSKRERQQYPFILLAWYDQGALNLRFIDSLSFHPPHFHGQSIGRQY